MSDACASYATLNDLNRDLQPAITNLTRTTDFFSYYRLNLYDKVCPFWSDEGGLCGNIACAVTTIDNEEDIPAMWRSEALGKLEGPKAHHPNRKLQQETRPLHGELGDDVGESCVVEYDDECDERDYCVPEDESAAAKGDYVSLVENPERFTGYSGPSAHQVWEAIYRENCFSKVALTDGATLLDESSSKGATDLPQAAQDLKSVFQDHNRLAHLASGNADGTFDEASDVNDECLEKRVFYRVISGMHASISMHLCHDYLNQTTGHWGPNLSCYQSRLHDHPDRISNIYFNYALVLRAVAKVKEALKVYTFCSGDVPQDRATKRKVLALASSIAAGGSIYDETLMFQDPSVAGLKEDFRNRFRNVSRTMDCVGCDKCRLWGKLQTAGYGTALKILFEFDEHDIRNNPPLRRTELVALLNTLDKLSHSLSALREFEDLMHEVSTIGRAVPVSSRSTTEQSSELYEDDGHSETVSPPSRTVIDEFMAEWTFVWRAFKWVIRSWLGLPKKLYVHLFVTRIFNG